MYIYIYICIRMYVYVSTYRAVHTLRQFLAAAHPSPMSPHGATAGDCRQ